MIMDANRDETAFPRIVMVASFERITLEQQSIFASHRHWRWFTLTWIPKLKHLVACPNRPG
jgi:hypothetical protein